MNPNMKNDVSPALVLQDAVIQRTLRSPQLPASANLIVIQVDPFVLRSHDLASQNRTESYAASACRQNLECCTGIWNALDCFDYELIVTPTDRENLSVILVL
mmetsp:Transcript_6311/g.10890  ORF Transcript_6311/g.10890 Transcript_6311/m.10890 type:complete len:102 (+) Transcript_6311:1169-1474(+)